MSYNNPLMVELMVPRDPEVDARISGFYQDIGWGVRDDTDSEFFTYVSPSVENAPKPTIAYWQTETAAKIARFDLNEANAPSHYAHGLQIAGGMLDLVEICLIVPSDDDVHAIFEQGGRLLDAHAHIKPRGHAGKQEFRFVDPFSYSLRVTANPGWEVEQPEAISSEFVTHFPLDGTSELTPIVTKSDLMAFAKSRNGSTAYGSRAYTALRNGARLGMTLAPFCVQDDEGAFIGVLPDKIKELVKVAESGAVSIYQYSPTIGKLLLDLHKEIFPEETES